MVTFNITYDSSVDSAPATFKPQIQQACANIASKCSTNVSVNIQFSFGSLQGQPLSAGAIGESSANYQFSTFAKVQAALLAANPTFSVPATDPTNGGTFLVWNACAKALGLLPDNTGLDGFVGIGSANDFDVIAVAEHEISEIMGRVLLCDQVSGSTGTPNFITPYDLFDYSSPGVHSYVGSQSRYFSVDNGVTVLNTFNSTPGADWGDWRGDTNDPCDAFYQGSEVLSTSDDMVFQALGWKQVTIPPPPPPPPPPVPTCTLSASPGSLKAPGTVKLSGTTTNAMSASIDNGVGPVSLGSFSVSVPVLKTMKFTLTAINSVGQSTASSNVSVKQKGPHQLKFSVKRLDKHV